MAEHGKRPAASARSRTVARTSFTLAWVCLGFAGISAVAATAIYMPSHRDRSVLASQLRSSIAPEPSERAFDVAVTWREEWTHFVGRVGVETDAHIPAGGLSTLLATRFPSAAHVRLPDAASPVLADTDVTTPLPIPRPEGIERQIAAPQIIVPQVMTRNAPSAVGPQLASLPPQSETAYAPAVQPKQDGIFEKLFGDPDKSAKAVLAANPNTVLYDIAKRAVYLPDGEKLEAHSGYGEWMDDVESVHRKNVGVTPPNVYAVSFREKPFHGVRALRMKPVGNGNMYGRDGILAHSYLLGEAGASNGCISLKDYDKFLKAYEDGKFTQILVVRSADEPAPVIASAQGQGT
jgi:hypothetical protein